MTEKEIFERIKGAYEVDAMAVVANMIVQAYEIGYSDGVKSEKASKEVKYGKKLGGEI